MLKISRSRDSLVFNMGFMGRLIYGMPVIVGMVFVNSSPPSATYMHRCTGSALVQVMAYRRRQDIT